MTPEEERRMRMQVAAILGPKAGEVVTQSAVTPEMLQAAGQSTDGQRSAIARQARTAEALRSTATPEGRSAGGIYVASNPLEHLGAIGDKAWGRKVAREVRGQEEALDQTEAEKAVGQMELEQARLADANAREDRIRREDQGFKWDLMEANRIARRQEAAEKRALERTIRQQAALTEVGEGNVEIAKGRRQRFEDFVDRSKDRMESSAKGGKVSDSQRTAKMRADLFGLGLEGMQSALGSYDPETKAYANKTYDPGDPISANLNKLAASNNITRGLADQAALKWESDAENTKEGLLRAMTGAAAPEKEHLRYASSLIPAPGEDDETIYYKMQKLDRLYQYMREAAGEGEIDESAARAAATRMYEEDHADKEGGEAQPEAPEVGTVQDGYRFRGGNAADQNNWEKI